MARKHRENQPVPTDTPEDGFRSLPTSTKVRWRNPYLSTQDVQWLSDNVHLKQEYMARLADSIEPGFSLSSKYDFHASRWLATIVCQNANHEAGGCGISVRGSTATNALFALASVIFSSPDLKWWLEVGDGAGGDFG